LLNKLPISAEEEVDGTNVSVSPPEVCARCLRQKDDDFCLFT